MEKQKVVVIAVIVIIAIVVIASLFLALKSSPKATIPKQNMVSPEIRAEAINSVCGSLQKQGEELPDFCKN